MTRLYIGPKIMLTIDSRMDKTFQARSPISYKHMFFWVFVIRSTIGHAPLKYTRCHLGGNRIRLSYLAAIGLQLALRSFPPISCHYAPTFLTVIGSSAHVNTQSKVGVFAK
jgi:hypothetical protein